MNINVKFKNIDDLLMSVTHEKEIHPHVAFKCGEIVTYYIKEQFDFENKVISFTSELSKYFIIKNGYLIYINDYVTFCDQEEATYLKLRYL